MLRRIGLLTIIALLGCASHRGYAIGRWVLLGQRQVTDRADHDVVPVTGALGDFHRINFAEQRSSVDEHRVVVHVAHGSDQRVDPRHTIGAGGQSRAIDLEGGDRVIRSVDFWCDANNVGRGVAQVQVYGLRSRLTSVYG